MDTVSDVRVIMVCCSGLKSMRNLGVDDYSQQIFEYSSKIAERSSISVIMPRISECQQHRSNPEYVSYEVCLKKTIPQSLNSL